MKEIYNYLENDIKLNDKDITKFPPRKVTESGLGHIPQDRHKHGLVLDYPMDLNMVLQTYYQKPYTLSFHFYFYPFHLHLQK